MSETNTCPHCGANLDGGSILETFLQQRAEGREWCKGMSDEEIEKYMKENYSPPYRWSRAQTVQYRGAHFQKIICPDCKNTIG